MGSQQQVAIGHRVNTCCFKITQQQNVAFRARHLDPLALAEVDELTVCPEAHRLFSCRALALCDLIFMMWEDQVDATSVNVELLSEVPGCHGRAFDVPAREADTPGTRPVHLPGFIPMLP